MISYHLTTFTARFRIIIIAWLIILFIPLTAGCPSFSFMKKPTKGILFSFNRSNDAFKKKIGMASFENKSFLSNQVFEEIFQKNLLQTIQEECSNTLLVEPSDAECPNFLADPPRKPSGAIDNLSLAITGKLCGFNALVTGKLVYIKPNTTNRGFWLFKKPHHFASIRIDVAIYDVETAAKLIDEIFQREIKLDPSEFESIVAAQKTGMPKINKALENFAEDIGDTIGDTISALPWTGFVVSVDGNKTTLSSGSKAGLAPGDILEVYDSGNIIEGSDDLQFFLPGPQTGKIKITSVQPDRSEADPVSDKYYIRAGSSVKQPKK